MLAREIDEAATAPEIVQIAARLGWLLLDAERRAAIRARQRLRSIHFHRRGGEYKSERPTNLVSKQGKMRRTAHI